MRLDVLLRGVLRQVPELGPASREAASNMARSGSRHSARRRAAHVARRSREISACIARASSPRAPCPPRAHPPTHRQHQGRVDAARQPQQPGKLFFTDVVIAHADHQRPCLGLERGRGRACTSPPQAGRTHFQHRQRLITNIGPARPGCRRSPALRGAIKHHLVCPPTRLRRAAEGNPVSRRPCAPARGDLPRWKATRWARRISRAASAGGSGRLGNQASSDGEARTPPSTSMTRTARPRRNSAARQTPCKFGRNVLAIDVDDAADRITEALWQPAP